jgi:iron complex transport system substrate-binding protein
MKMIANLSRRSLLALGSASALVVMSGCERQAATGDGGGLTDLRGRSLAVVPPISRLSIDDGRYLIGLALIHPDPVSLLAAWSGDVNRISPEMYAEFVERFPALADLPRTPSSADDFSVEAVLSAAPELAVVSLGSGPTDAQVAQLEGAGVQVAFIDFFSHPFENQAPSLTLLGRLIGREEQAEAYNQFREAKLNVIRGRVAGIAEADRPSVLMEAHAGGPDCCNSPGRGNVGDYIEFVGGRNIGAAVLDAPSGRLNLEYVIEQDPDVYIPTGGPHMAERGGFVVGPQFTEAQSLESLRRVASRRGIETLGAVRNGRTHGLSHQLINSPIDIVATEALARWIHPDLFADLDPRETLNQINERFLAVPYSGTYWTNLPAA